ncbi:type 2 lanthipeptide synthetase LanM family protein [Oceanitalea stevensii]|uniref:Type 2 lantipeptide synthetase LanM family protein n=1 Tax=Oceanitalea stevensii TaxID=2763072 RepID=A0ABR8Z6P2_9MICO|nr:type 2 lanthipeptide synthetase LanM family protein [Oceanitalea stevensii]MBD8063586.1 type 2 lantipeptide synthetase LanM family protein [Oceanitalea stevensii]
MTVASTAGLDQAVATYVPELAGTRRPSLTALLSHHRRDRDETFGGSDRTRLAQELLAPFLDPAPGPVSSAEGGRDPRFTGWTRVLVSAWLRAEHESLSAHPALADGAAFVGPLVEDGVALASETLVRTLVEVLAERREAGALTGATPEARFDDFRAWIGSPDGASALAHRYPTAVVRAHALVVRRARSVREVLDHLVADLPDLRATLPGLDGDVRVHSLHLGAGDTHDGGRTVGLLDLGRHGHLVHKPRSLAADRALHGLARGLNAALGTSLRVPRTLTRDHHGWAEYVDGTGAPTSDGRHPYRLGELAAVLYLLRSTDMHYENVVTDAAGRPVVVDAETVLSAVPVREPSYADGAGSRHARALLEDSVIGIGLLPLRVSVPGRPESLDIGASGSMAAGQASPFRSLAVRDAGRDDMHIALEPGRVGTGNTNPHAGTELDAVVRFRDGVRRGLEDTLRRVMEHRDVVEGLVRRELTGVRVRHVNIPTVFYAQLLRMCSHPDLLEDPDAHLAVLGRVSLRNTAARSAAAHEVAQLLGDDVPLFTVDAHGTDLLDARGRTLVPDFFDATPVDRVLSRLHALDEAEVARQADLVDVAFVPRIPDGGERTAPLTRPTPPPAPDRDVVTGAVDRLLSRWVPATDPAHPATFWGPLVTTSDASQWTPGSLGYDLYGGSVGVALALAEAGHLYDVPRARDVAAAVLDPIRAQVLGGALESQPVSAGGMTGMGGTVWAVAAADRLSGRGTGDHARLVDALAATVRPDTVPDLTAGLAGALTAGCGIVGRVEDVHREAATDALARLAARALPGLERVTTAPADGDQPVFTGYAHGLAGMLAPAHRAAHALSGTHPELSARLAALGSALLGLLLAQTGEDGDLPRTVGGSDSSWAWCHGAPGVLLGLLEVAELGAEVPERLLVDLGRQTQDRGLGNNPTYCHGDLGSLAALHRLALHTGDEDARRRWTAETRSRAGRTALRDRASARDRYTGTDSLMVGRAGALHALLRTTAPADCPDVLTLE